MPEVQLICGEKGSALVKVMGIAALFAVIMPAMFVIIQNSSDRQARRTAQERYISLVQALQKQLQDPSSCSILLKNLPVPAAEGAERSITINWNDQSDLSDPALNPLKKGWVSKDKLVEIADVTIRRTAKNAFNNVRLKVAGTVYNLETIPIRIYVKPSNILINLADKDDPTKLSVQKPETIPAMNRPEIMIQLHANVIPAIQRIESCFGANSLAAACENMGGGYNNSGPPAFKCQPDKICFTSLDGLVDNASSCTSNSSGIPFKAKLMGRVGSSENYLCTLCFEDLE